jgi:hypothetical protein
LGECPSTDSVTEDPPPPKGGKLSGHFSMVKGRKPLPLKQVMPHLGGTDDGMAQLRDPGL